MKPDLVVDIVAYFTMIDDILIGQTKNNAIGPGRPSALTHSELITIVIYGMCVFKTHTLKDLWKLIHAYHRRDFPTLPSYQSFVDHVHRALPLFVYVLERFLANNELRFMDSTKLEVCRLTRADTHKLAKGISRVGKNHQGWWYGFKLHASINTKAHLCAVHITPANVHDQNITPILTEGRTRIAVGDAGYRSSMMNRLLWEQRGVFILTPPHWKQKNKLMTAWQHILLRGRSKIEAVFDYLKNHMSLVSSFPRSVTGYLVRYITTLLAYQFSLVVIS